VGDDDLFHGDRFKGELAAHGRQPDEQARAIQLLVHVQLNTFRHAASVYGRARLPLLRIGVGDARPITKSVPEQKKRPHSQRGPFELRLLVVLGRFALRRLGPV
jgi:hypothetical protein